MLEDLNRLDLTRQDLELIESALHTQKKILAVQSEAGGTGARQKLTELKRLMKRIGRARPQGTPEQPASFAQLARGFFAG